MCWINNKKDHQCNEGGNGGLNRSGVKWERVSATGNLKGKRAHFWDKSLGGASNATSLSDATSSRRPLKSRQGSKWRS